MKIVLEASHAGHKQTLEKEGDSAFIGRGDTGEALDFDLSPDAKVSRQHARIWYDGQTFWIEDLQSKGGTQLNGEEIRGCGPRRISAADKIQVGNTRLILRTIPGDEPRLAEVPFNAPEVPVKIVRAPQTATAPEATLAAGAKSTVLERRLALLCELPLVLAAESNLERRLQIIVEQLVELVPGAVRGALLLKDLGTGRLLLKACVPRNQPAVSLRLAQRAISNREAFIWHRAAESDLAGGSILYHKIATGMYAPLLWSGNIVGALCVDNPDRDSRFTAADLGLVKAVAQFASMAIGQHYGEEALRRQSEFSHRLFGSRFPPRVRESLLQQAAAESLVIGTRKSPVTVLISDIRGFTKLSEQIGAQRLSDLLNDYFPPLIEAIFQFGGSIERFVGDAIFAVFGSPEADNDQQENAVRAALEMQSVARALSAARASRRTSTCEIGIGIDSGPVLHGFIGNAERMEFAVIGPAANYAQRYCNGAQPGQVVISAAVHSQVWNLVNTQSVTIETKHEGQLQAYLVEALRST